MTTATVEQTNKRSSRAKSQERLALALIAPTLIVLTIVIVIPVIQSVKQTLYGQPRRHHAAHPAPADGPTCHRPPRHSGPLGYPHRRLSHFVGLDL